MSQRRFVCHAFSVAIHWVSLSVCQKDEINNTKVFAETDKVL